MNTIDLHAEARIIHILGDVNLRYIRDLRNLRSELLSELKIAWQVGTCHLNINRSGHARIQYCIDHRTALHEGPEFRVLLVDCVLDSVHVGEAAGPVFVGELRLDGRGISAGIGCVERG